DNHRVDDGEKVIFLLAARRVRHHDAFVHADLRSRKAHAGGFVHGFNHVLDELHLSIGDIGDRVRWLFQNFRTPELNRADHNAILTLATDSTDSADFNPLNPFNPRLHSPGIITQLFQVAFVVSLRLLNRIATELLQKGLGQYESHHRFAD